VYTVGDTKISTEKPASYSQFVIIMLSYSFQWCAQNAHTCPLALSSPCSGVLSARRYQDYLHAQATLPLPHTHPLIRDSFSFPRCAHKTGTCSTSGFFLALDPDGHFTHIQ
jgi:hypothetical protein